MRTTKQTFFMQVLCILIMMLAPIAAHASCWQWSTTAASNATADPSINWAEGMAPSAVNDSARAMMARSAECRDDLSGKLLSTGSSTAYAVTSNQGDIPATPNDGQQIVFRPHVANGVAPTLAVDGGTAFPIQTAPGVAIGSGVLQLGSPYRFTFVSASNAWVAQDFYASGIAAGSIVTSMLRDNAVTYQKIQKPSGTSKLLGTPSLAAISVTGTANNGSGLIRLTLSTTTGLSTGNTKVVSGVVGTTEANGTWVITVIDGTHVDLQGSTFANTYVSGGVIGGSVEEITLGTGLGISGNQIVAAPAPPSVFKNLSIKVTGNTTVSVAADYVTTTNGSGSFRTTPVACAINFATTGALGLDFGSIASSTWYAIWVNVKDDSTTTCTASLQFSANGTFLSHLPSGYTHYARIGAVRTASGVAQLMGTWQFGNKAQYVVGLAQTVNVPKMQVGAAGSDNANSMVAISVSSFVPPTASVISWSFLGQYNAGGLGIHSLAPNNNFGAQGSTNPPPVVDGDGTRVTMVGEFLLESTNIYYFAAASGAALLCRGWEDNL